MSQRRGFLDDYEPVDARLARFWDDNSDGRVETTIIEHDEKRWVIRADLFRRGIDVYEHIANGHAEEIVGSSNVNRTSALENCETSAIGRALANAGYAAKGKPRPSREEMKKVAGSDAPAITPPAGDALEDASEPTAAQASSKASPAVAPPTVSGGPSNKGAANPAGGPSDKSKGGDSGDATSWGSSGSSEASPEDIWAEIQEAVKAGRVKRTDVLRKANGAAMEQNTIPEGGIGFDTIGQLPIETLRVVRERLGLTQESMA